MLKEYQIENFKAFAGPVTIPIRPLTLIFGANSSGKSAILQSLLMLKQTLEESDGSKALLPKGSLVDLGSYGEFIHGHNVQNEFSFKMTLDSPKSIAEDSALDDEVTDILMPETNRLERTIDFDTIGLSVHFRWDQTYEAIVTKLDLFFGQDPKPVVSYSKEKQGSKIGEDVKWENVNKALAIACQTEEGKQRLRRLLERRDYWANANYDHPYWNNYNHEFPEGKTISDDSINLKGFLPELLKSELMYRIISLRYGNEDEAKSISLFALCAANLIKKILTRIDHVRPLRDRPKRHYLVGENREMDRLLENDSLLEDVNKILSRIGVKYQAEIARFSDKNGRVAGVYGLQMKDTATDLVASVNDVGFGVSQIFPVVLTSVLSEKALVLVEQPELHLHPALQAELGDMFIESALGERKNTFIIESHSEHLLLRIMRRMRETSNGELPEGVQHVTPNDVCVLFVQSKGTSSAVRHLELDEEGQLLDSWPGGFFEEGYRERFS